MGSRGQAGAGEEEAMMRRRGIIALFASMVGHMRAQRLSVGDPVFQLPKEYEVTLDTDLIINVGGKSFLLTQEEIARELAQYEVKR